MDFQALRALTAIHDTGSFSLAAKELFITQPAISKRISSIEAELSVKLIDRHASPIALTEAGAILLASAERILVEVANAEDQIRSLENEVGGRLRIGTSHHIGIHRLPPVLRSYTNNFTEVELDLKFMDSEEARDHVESGLLELAVVTLPETIPSHLLTSEIWSDPLEIVIPRDHPLAKSNTATPDSLALHPAILPAKGTITRAVLESALAPFDAEISVAMDTNYLETIKMMVSVGLGWSVLPSSMITSELVPIAVKGLNMRRSLGTLRLKHRSLSRAAASFLDIIEHERDV